MNSMTFTTQMPMPKGWKPKKLEPKKLGLFSVIRFWLRRQCRIFEREIN